METDTKINIEDLEDFCYFLSKSKGIDSER